MQRPLFDTLAPGDSEILIKRFVPADKSAREGGTDQSQVSSDQTNIHSSGGGTFATSIKPGTTGTIVRASADPTDDSEILLVKCSFPPQRQWQIINDLYKVPGAKDFISQGKDTQTEIGRSFLAHLKGQCEKGILRPDLMTRASNIQSGSPTSSADPNVFPSGALCDAFEQMRRSVETASTGPWNRSSKSLEGPQAEAAAEEEKPESEVEAGV